MPPMRSMSSVKPVKTERTHEENQERAYIAASRRSDRSLEARVESARRASEIHKRRTGRSLRVTEQDVVNEEMYEEEDDDLPMQYRRLTAHLNTQNADFDRRLQAYLTNHVAMRTALGQAVSDAWQGNTQNQLQNGGHFMNPGMMQMPPQQNFHQQMMPPQQAYSRSPANYRQAPYPQSNQAAQNMRHRLSTSQEGQAYQQQPSAHASPVEATKVGDRRTSLPRSPHSQVSQQQSTSPAHVSPAASRSGSLANIAALRGQSKASQSPPQQPQHYHQQPMSSPFSAAFEQQVNHGFNPLSMTLPMESQQLLAGNPYFGANDSMTSMFMSSPTSMKPQQPFYSYNPNGNYSYNPNGKPKSTTATTPPNFDGLNQTLAPASLDTTVGNFENSSYMPTPQSAGVDPTYAPFTPGAYGMGYDMSFGVDPLKGSGSSDSSGLVTPVEADWPGFLDDSAFLDQSAL